MSSPQNNTNYPEVVVRGQSFSIARVGLVLFLVPFIPISILTVLAVPVFLIGGAISGGHGTAVMFVPILMGFVEWIILRKINAKGGKAFGIFLAFVSVLTIAFVYWIVVLPIAAIAAIIYTVKKCIS
jgi:hypothetical protein